MSPLGIFFRIIEGEKVKIIDSIKDNKKRLSFEVFPPKTDASFDSVEEAAFKIAELKPSFMSVTYGAGGGTSKYTLDIARDIKNEHNIETLAHLTCVSSSKETVLERIKDLKEAGIENIMALRGDLTPEMSLEDSKSWDYKHASELVYDIKKAGDFCIGGACYPEVHPESKNHEEDILHLKEKVEAGCEFLTTQMFFENNLLYNFIDKLEKHGIYVPVVAGIMPITNINQVERALNLSGSYMPPKFLNLVEKYGSDKLSMKQAGISYATEQIIDLYANGITNVHVYTMNSPEVARTIMGNVSNIINK